LVLVAQCYTVCGGWAGWSLGCLRYTGAGCVCSPPQEGRPGGKSGHRVFGG